MQFDTVVNYYMKCGQKCFVKVLGNSSYMDLDHSDLQLFDDQHFDDQHFDNQHFDGLHFNQHFFDVNLEVAKARKDMEEIFGGSSLAKTSLDHCTARKILITEWYKTSKF